MINVDSKNTFGDFQRLLWFIVPVIASFLLGYLVSFYVDENNIFQNPSTITFSCPSVEPQIIVLPIKLLKTGA